MERKNPLKLTKEDIEEGKQEFAYINNCYKELILEHFNIDNYKEVFDNTNETLEKLVYYEVHTRCFYRVQENIEGTNPIIVCYYRTETEKMPKLLAIKEFKKGFKFYFVFKGQKYKSTMVYFTNFTKFTNTYNDLIETLKTKYTNKFYC